jgi:hypothetical protein
MCLAQSMMFDLPYWKARFIVKKPSLLVHISAIIFLRVDGNLLRHDRLLIWEFPIFCQLCFVLTCAYSLVEKGVQQTNSSHIYFVRFTRVVGLKATTIVQHDVTAFLTGSYKHLMPMLLVRKGLDAALCRSCASESSAFYLSSFRLAYPLDRMKRKWSECVVFAFLA